jgi:hypothetical protein
VERTAYDDQTIIRYLLNELSEEDGMRLEEAYLEDESLFERLRALEEELIEEYVKGELSGRERELFERHYLASEQRRARIETARQLVQICSVKSAVRPAPNDRIDSKFFYMSSWLRLIEKQHLNLGFGVAAALLLIVGLGLVIELLRLRGQLAVVGEERAGLEQRVEEGERRLTHEREQLAEERKQVIALREELGDVNSRLGRLEQELARSQTSKNESVFLALAPGVRDINKADRIVISSDTKFVELRVNLEKQEAATPSVYRAVVKTVDGGKEIWSLEGIKLRQTRSTQYVVVRVPADRFRAASAQDFTLTLSAPIAGGKDYEEIEIIYFQAIAK